MNKSPSETFQELHPFTSHIYLAPEEDAPGGHGRNDAQHDGAELRGGVEHHAQRTGALHADAHVFHSCLK